MQLNDKYTIKMNTLASCHAAHRRAAVHSYYESLSIIRCYCMRDQCKDTRELTVVTVTGPGTWLLCHGEQGVRDVRQEAVQVKHVGLHRCGFRVLIHLIGPLLRLGLADLTLKHISQRSKQNLASVKIPDLSIRGLPANRLKRSECKMMHWWYLVFSSCIHPTFGREIHVNTKKLL